MRVSSEGSVDGKVVWWRCQAPIIPVEVDWGTTYRAL